MRREKDFAEAKMRLKLSKIEGDNKTTDYDLYFNRQEDSDINACWFCMVEIDKDGNNVKQFDFDDVPRKDVVNMVKQMIEVLKADLKDKL